MNHNFVLFNFASDHLVIPSDQTERSSDKITRACCALFSAPHFELFFCKAGMTKQRTTKDK